MTFNYDCIGGVMQDLAPDFVDDVKALLAVLPKNIKEYNEIFTGNVIAKNRMEGVGVLSREDAIAYGVTGPSGRASAGLATCVSFNPTASIQNSTSKKLLLPKATLWHVSNAVCAKWKNRPRFSSSLSTISPTANIA